MRNNQPVSALCIQLSALIFFLTVPFFFTACGTDSNHFKIDGRFIHLNQGEFYVYSPDGGLDGLDTIKVNGGRFAFEMPCNRECILMLVFPNFSEQPIFAAPGETADLKGDASHLKEMEVTGTKANKMMTMFRKQIVSASPPDIVKYADQFIQDNPDSPVGAYLVSKYFMQGSPNFKRAVELIDIMQEKQKENGYLIRLRKMAETQTKGSIGSKMPVFSGVTVYGEKVTQQDLTGSKLAVLSVWSSWNFESMTMQKELKKLQRKAGGQLKLVSVCVDAFKKECINRIEQDTIKWPTICDEKMFEGDVISQTGLSAVPDNIVIQNGKIIARGLNVQELREKIESHL